MYIYIYIYIFAAYYIEFNTMILSTQHLIPSFHYRDNSVHFHVCSTQKDENEQSCPSNENRKLSLETNIYYDGNSEVEQKIIIAISETRLR